MKLLWSGACAGSNGPGFPNGQGFVQYDEAADIWSTIRNPFGTNTSHGFDAQDIDVRGRRYYRSIGGAGLAQWNLDTNSYIGMTAHPNAGFSTFPIVAFHPGMGEAGKVVVIYYRADAGRVITFDPSTQSFDAERPSPYRDEWGVPGNCCFVTAANKILFGSAGGKEAYTIDADGTIAPIAAAPANFGTQEDDASHCLLVPHPTLGAAFMFSSNGNVYKYAFSSNSWSLVGQMPSGVCDTLYAKDKVSRSFAVAVPAHRALDNDVIAFVGYRDESSVFHLYRP